MSWLWKWLAAIAATAAGVLMIVWRFTDRRLTQAQEAAYQFEQKALAAQHAIDQRNKAENAMTDAAEEGRGYVEQVFNDAGRGKRDHFSRGMRD